MIGVLIVSQLYHLRTLDCRRLYTRILKDSTLGANQNGGSCWSGRLKLFDSVLLPKKIKVERRKPVAIKENV